MCHHNFWLTHCIEELRNRILYLRYAHHVRTNSHDKSGFGIRHFECHVGAFLRNCISIQRCRRSEEMVDTFYRRFYGDLQHPQVFWGECLILFGIKLTQIRKWIFSLRRPWSFSLSGRKMGMDFFAKWDFWRYFAFCAHGRTETYTMASSLQKMRKIVGKN